MLQTANTSLRLIMEGATVEPGDAAGVAAVVDDWSIEAIAAEADRSDGSASQLSGLFHVARIAANYPAARLRSARREARAIHPRPPAEICGVDQDGGPPTWQFPEPGWSAERVEIFNRWEQQCGLIDKALGVGVFKQEDDAARRLRSSLGVKAVNAPVRTIADARDKLGVITWRVEIEELEPPEVVALLQRLSADLDALAN